MTALYPRTSDHAYSHMAPLGRCDNFHHTARCCVPQIWTFLSLEKKGDSGQPLFGLSDDDGSLFESQFSFMPRLCRNNVRDVFKPTVCAVTVFTASPSLLPILLQTGCQQKSEWEPFTACNHAAHAHQSTVKSYSKTSLGPQKLSPCPNIPRAATGWEFGANYRQHSTDLLGCHQAIQAGGRPSDCPDETRP